MNFVCLLPFWFLTTGGIWCRQPHPYMYPEEYNRMGICIASLFSSSEKLHQRFSNWKYFFRNTRLLLSFQPNILCVYVCICVCVSVCGVGFGWPVEIDLRVNHFPLFLLSLAWVVCRPRPFLSLKENKVVYGRGQHFKLVEFNATNDIELTRKDRQFVEGGGWS